MKNFLLVTNFCPFYRIKLFKILNDELKLKILFYSAGTDKYWESSMPGSRSGSPPFLLAMA